MDLFPLHIEDDPWVKPEYTRPHIDYKEEQNMTQINKEQAMKELEELKKEFDERTKKLEEIINKKEDAVWKPKKEEQCYFINSCGDVKVTTWVGCSIDNDCYNMGNCYKTKQEAEDARDAQIILTDLQRMADEANGGRLRGAEYGQDVYILFNHHSMRHISWTRTDNMVIKNMCPCFKRQKEVIKAQDTLISKYGEDKVKMALSGVWR